METPPSLPIFRKPKTQRGKRAVERKEPKIFENVKNCMLVKGGNTSQLVTQALKELVRQRTLLRVPTVLGRCLFRVPTVLGRCLFRVPTVLGRCLLALGFLAGSAGA